MTFLLMLAMLVSLCVSPARALGPTICVLDGVVEFIEPISDESEFFWATGPGSLTCSGLFSLSEAVTISFRSGLALPVDELARHDNCGLIAAGDLFAEGHSGWELTGSLSGQFHTSGGPGILFRRPQAENLKVGSLAAMMTELQGDCTTGVESAKVKATAVLEDVSNVVPMLCHVDATVDFTIPVSNTSTDFSAVGTGSLFCHGADIIFERVDVELFREQAGPDGVEPGGSCALIVGARLSAMNYSRIDFDLGGTAEEMVGSATMHSRDPNPYAGATRVQLRPTSGNCETGIRSVTLNAVAIMSGITRSGI